jgi:hypothetical protein
VTRVPSCIMYARVVFCRPAHLRSVFFFFFLFFFVFFSLSFFAFGFVARRSEAGREGLVFI